MKWGWLLLGTAVMGPRSWAKEPPLVAVCDVELTVGQEGTLLEEAKRLGIQVLDHPDSLTSAVPDPSKHQSLSALSVGGKPVVWARSNGELFVDEQLMGPLTVVHATRIQSGQVMKVGTVVNPSSLDAVELIRQLMVSNVITTFLHIGSELCLKPTPTGVSVKGTHTYFTNKKNVDEIAFSVELDSAGLITVTGA